jgi:hypothetical protein
MGLRRNKDIAVAVGCTQNQLSRWAQMARPPKQMRKGFDDALARVLRVERVMLFSQWAELDPEMAPIPSAGDERLRIEIIELMRALRGDDLAKVYDFVRQMLRGRIAKDFGIEASDIDRAAIIRANSPELFEACWLGHLTLDQAEQAMKSAALKQKRG